MKFECTDTYNWENAFRGLRHPLESYARSDSQFGLADNDAWMDEIAEDVALSFVDNWKDERIDPDKEEIKNWLFRNGGWLQSGKYAGTYAFIGNNDLDLAQRMIKAGSPNDKFLRQIFVSVDITAPLYWWKEMDTYKVATVANSTSTMHKLATTPITIDCFETGDLNEWMELNGQPLNYGFEQIIKYCEDLRQKYLETKDMRYWKELIRWLPEGWLQTRTWTANYATLRNIIHWRKGHKLVEWAQFLDWCKTLPYADELLFFEN